MASTNNHIVLCFDLRLCHLALVHAAQDFEALFVPIVASEPARRLGDQEDQDHHGQQEDALHDRRHSPYVACLWTL